MKRAFSIILTLSFFIVSNAQNKNLAPDLKGIRDTLNKKNAINIAPAQKTREKKAPAHRITTQWTLSPDYTEEVRLPFDTVFSLFQRYRISDRYSPMNATLGNYGLPFYQLDFFDRITDPDKFLYSDYYPLMYLNDKTVFMNTQVPFTEAVWTFGAPRETSEQTLRIRHSQNINRFLNFGLIFDIVYSLGQYNYQRSEDKTFTFFTSYTGLKYKLYFSAGVNNLTAYQNGGITSTDQLSLLTGRDVPVNMGSLNDAKSVLRNRSILIVQKYRIGANTDVKDTTMKASKGFLGLSGTFTHVFAWEINRRSYTDRDPTSGFYDTAYISKYATSDSLYSRVLRNTIRFDFTTDESRKFRLGGGIGIRNELYRFAQVVPSGAKPAVISTDTAAADTIGWNRTSNVLLGKLYSDIGSKFMWVANGELVLTGYRAGDFTLNGKISKSFAWKKGLASWVITGDMMNREPSFWYDHYGSNNFEWDNNFNKEFRIDIGTDFSYPARNAEVKLNYAIINNFTDFNTSALPSQYSGALSVAALYARKELRAWKFHLATDLLIQKSSNSSILDLPLVSVRSAGYFEHLFRFPKTNGKLNTQIGADVLYYTPYYGYAWMPATGVFYRQDSYKTGDYPYINVFINLKLQRTRIFVMLDHVNSGFMGYNYFMVPNYPQNVRMLRYGIAWTFYN